jgi:uncharacterized membrane protein YjgN (DUF898 family)
MIYKIFQYCIIIVMLMALQLTIAFLYEFYCARARQLRTNSLRHRDRLRKISQTAFWKSFYCLNVIIICIQILTGGTL